MEREIEHKPADFVHTLPIIQSNQTRLAVGEKYRFTPTGLLFSGSERLSFEEFDELGIRIKGMQTAVEWSLADWVKYGELNFKERFHQAAVLTGYKAAYVEQIVSTANRVPPINRTALPFAHHRVVASISDPIRQAALLREAEDENLTVSELQARVNRINSPKGETPEIDRKAHV